MSRASRIINSFLVSRIEDNVYYTPSSIRLIKEMCNKVGINTQCSLLKVRNDNEFHDKGISDQYAISLWNEIMGSKYHVSRISQLKGMSVKILADLDKRFPKGKGMNASDIIRYITAFSSSSFLGIQRPSKSKFAVSSMRNCDVLTLR